ncbi:MAG: sigma-70 family RNA polymerase sigma factor [Tannerellaceae bacterium]|jgi:RNA polymerase sigma factor (sigma-70 family)|nr:sigma-70 family RNA polymerase sigma factor [Tannerellaceae bacterium]
MEQKIRELDKWYEQYVDELFSYGTAFGIEKGYVLDAIHDVFLNLYESADKRELPDNPKFYLLRSLKNRIISSKLKASNLLSLDDQPEYEFQINVDALALLENEEERLAYEEQLENLFRLLTNKQREVVYLHFMQELSYQEVAEILHVTPKSVRKIIYRALERMQGGIAPLWLLLIFLTE